MVYISLEHLEYNVVISGFIWTKDYLGVIYKPVCSPAASTGKSETNLGPLLLVTAGQRVEGKEKDSFLPLALKLPPALLPAADAHLKSV